MIDFSEFRPAFAHHPPFAPHRAVIFFSFAVYEFFFHFFGFFPFASPALLSFERGGQG
jgi:hypothetical protein